ncbi:hypothetical protein K435DRAFT_829595 [Dendrothele bispora CBS 962.96]|uniref:C2H2-type domain-containing protein n=1 Tax=Dendrothele bispora (strain CBS 962.96) TaxID=1314807 RepID=A0A4S8LUK0_DENBC|nr:hypothetical protein K435DRAFT_829595 [Dendrothele bispora CBS 962.96]
MPRKSIHPRNVLCPIEGCNRLFINQQGITTHIRNEHGRLKRSGPPGNPPDSPHANDSFCSSSPVNSPPTRTPEPEPEPKPEPEGLYTEEIHPFLNEGNYLASGALPPPFDPPSNDYYLYEKRTSFELADLLYRREQMSGGNINELLRIWAADSDRDPPFANKADMLETIDTTIVGDIPWQCFTLSYDSPLPDKPEPWMKKKFEVYYRDPRLLLQQQLGSRDFVGEIDHAPKKVVDQNGRVFENFMEGQWIWQQADKLAQDPNMHGCTLVPTICGSDKTTVSVATGQNEYYPFYLSQGNIHNNVRRAHRDGISLCAFLAIPKTDREHDDSALFRRFRRHLFHTSLREILKPLLPGMTTPEVVRFGDGHYRRVVYCLGPYIADYPEQVMLACIVQNWCSRCTAHRTDLDGEGGRQSHVLTEALMNTMSARTLWDDYGIVDGIMPFTHYFPHTDIHELIAPDLLHQIIKGTFKDHLVTWMEKYLNLTYSKAEAKKIKAEIDRRIAAIPPFPGLHRFPEGRGYKQWTGDDSKALMKVILPAISGLVPPQMVRTFSAFLEFCYLVWRNIINQETLVAIDAAVARFHHERDIFREVGVRDEDTTLGFSIPRQHALSHYRYLIEEFGAPNGLCSSITESKHIKAVKEPWWRSRRFEALGQMLVINSRMDKPAASQVDFKSHGMLDGPLSEKLELVMGEIPEDADDDDVKLARCPIRSLPKTLDALANHIRKVEVYPSAVATFYAPSDKSGIGGMHRERIRSTASWQGGPPRRDCVFVVADPDMEGFRGLLVAQVLLFFSIKRRKDTTRFPCALVTWFSTLGNEPCPETGMWCVTPDTNSNGCRKMDVIHLDSVLRGAHLIGIAGEDHLPRGFKYTDSLDAFKAFYVNKYADHHAHEIAF